MPIAATHAASYHLSPPNHVSRGVWPNKEIPAMRRVVRSVFPPGFDLAACFAAARAGDSQAIGQILEHCATYLRATMLSQVRRDRGPRDSDFDIVQTTLVRALERFHECQASTEGQLLLWLRRILVNNNALHR